MALPTKGELPEHTKEVVCLTEIGLYLGLYDEEEKKWYNDSEDECLRPSAWKYVTVPNEVWSMMEVNG